MCMKQVKFCYTYILFPVSYHHRSIVIQGHCYVMETTSCKVFFGNIYTPAVNTQYSMSTMLINQNNTVGCLRWNDNREINIHFRYLHISLQCTLRQVCQTHFALGWIGLPRGLYIWHPCSKNFNSSSFQTCLAVLLLFSSYELSNHI